MASVLCHSCARPVPVPNDYNRRKIRCPDCGVYCEVPVAKEKKGDAKAVVKKASASNIAPDPWIDDILFKEDPLPACSTCGNPLTPNEHRSGSGGQCTRCKVLGGEGPVKKSKSLPPQSPKKPISKKVVSTQEDDGTPYRFAERLGSTCPQCEEEIGKTATSCSNCGHAWEIEPPPARVFEPVELEWESGRSYRKRVTLFLCFQCFGLLVAGMAIYTSNLAVFIFTWTITSAMLAFLLGTYARVNLTRNKKGKVVLTKTWRACFWQRPTEVVDLKEYVGVAAGKDFDDGIVNWLFCLFFLSLGIVPGIIWFYLALHRETHFVALTQAHGYKAFALYQGWDGGQAEEISTAVQEIAGLPLEKP